MANEIKNPQEAALKQLRTMLSNTSALSSIANKIMDQSLRDAVAWRNNGGSGECPVLLTQPSLNDFHRLKKGLQDLVDYYSKQVEIFGNHIGANAAVAVPANNIHEPEVDPVEQLRIQTEQLVLSAAVSEAPATLANDVPTVSGARAAAAATSTLPKPSALPAPVLPNLSQKRPPLENSIARLVGEQSPLLDIFAPAPWLPNGRGTVTVGSPGFQWYKNTDPFATDSNTRATLPSGFFGGEERPLFVVIRLETCILVWNFAMDPESMLVYMAQVSDTDPENLRWFKPSELSSSFTRRLVQELLATIPAHG